MPEITVTDNLPATHHQSALVLCKQWAAAWTPTSDLIDWTLHARPAQPATPDRLIYFPAKKNLLIYWGLSPAEDLANQLANLADQLPALGIQTGNLSQLLPKPVLSATRPPALTYWSGPYTGERQWQVRLQTTPYWYHRLDLRPFGAFLNRQALLATPFSGIGLTFQAYRVRAEPNHGFFHYHADDRLLLIEVPIPMNDLPRFASNPNQLFGLSLPAFLRLQPDPGIPGFAFYTWLEALEHQLREGRRSR